MFEFLQMKLMEMETSTQDTLTILNTIISITMTIINYLLSWTIAFMMKIEYSHSYTDELISKYKRALIASVLNSIFLPAVSIYIVKGTIFGPEGLAEKTLNFSITNCILPAFFTLVDLTFIAKRLALSITCIRNRSTYDNNYSYEVHADVLHKEPIITLIHHSSQQILLKWRCQHDLYLHLHKSYVNAWSLLL